MDVRLKQQTAPITPQAKIIEGAIGLVVESPLDDDERFFIRLYDRDLAKRLYKSWNREYDENKKYDFNTRKEHCEIITLKEKLDKILN